MNANHFRRALVGAALASILLAGQNAQGFSLDLTSQATFTSADPAVAQVDSLGWVTPVASGQSWLDFRKNTTAMAAKNAASMKSAP